MGEWTTCVLMLLKSFRLHPTRTVWLKQIPENVSRLNVCRRRERLFFCNLSNSSKRIERYWKKYYFRNRLRRPQTKIRHVNENPATIHPVGIRRFQLKYIDVNINFGFEILMLSCIHTFYLPLLFLPQQYKYFKI